MGLVLGYRDVLVFQGVAEDVGHPEVVGTVADPSVHDPGVPVLANGLYPRAVRVLNLDRGDGIAIASNVHSKPVGVVPRVEEIGDGLDTFRIRARAIGNPRLTR